MQTLKYNISKSLLCIPVYTTCYFVCRQNYFVASQNKYTAIHCNIVVLPNHSARLQKSFVSIQNFKNYTKQKCGNTKQFCTHTKLFCIAAKSYCTSYAKPVGEYGKAVSLHIKSLRVQNKNVGVQSQFVLAQNHFVCNSKKPQTIAVVDLHCNSPPFLMFNVLKSYKKLYHPLRAVYYLHCCVK